MKKFIFIVLVALSSVAAIGQSVQTHPRLWIRQQDVALLKAKANTNNPYFVAFKSFAEALKTNTTGANFDTQFTGSYSDYSEYPAETSAMIFAFMSLITEGAESQDYATRSHNIVMRIVDAAAQGVASGVPFRHPSYAVYDRSRWYFFGVPLAVDWNYSRYTAEEKQKIRTVFLRWCDENSHATTTTDNHPEPFEAGDKHPVKLSEQLLENNSSDAKSRRRVRYSSNNYYLAHLRNIYLMAGTLDAQDDAGNELHNYIDDITGSWLYVTNEYLQHEGEGGLSAEGFLYGPSAFGRLAQALLAIYTSGEAKPEVAMRGERSTFNIPFWQDVIPGIFNSVAPKSTLDHEWAFDGKIHLPLNYGDIQKFRVEDYIDLLGPLGWYYKVSGTDAEKLNQIKWLETHIPIGGKEGLTERFGASGGFFERGMFYFMLFDPNDNPTDPREQIPTTWHAKGIGRILSRTDWTEDASAFTFKCGFNRIDHQFGDGLSFSLYRKGAFVTSPLNGYGFDIAVSSAQNSLALENNNTGATNGPREIAQRYGSQWFLSPEGDGTITNWVDNNSFLYATGDATGLYTYINPFVTPTGNDITHASRSIVWVKPDHIITYDRATSKTENRYKQFWLGLPGAASISGKTAVIPVPNEQYLHITNLLPATAVLTAKSYAHDGDTNGFDEPAENEQMKNRIMIQDPANPKDIRFLHVLQARDNGTLQLATSLVQSADGSYQGSLIGDVVVMFKKDLSANFSTISFNAPQEASSFIITGLTPITAYNLVVTDNADGTQLITVSTGTGLISDTGGVLTYGEIAPDQNENPITGIINAEHFASVSPNPTTGNVTVSSTKEILETTVVDSKGKSLYKIKGAGQFKQVINLTGQMTGVYFITIKTSNGTETQKVIKY
jgi:hypothetical protein